ncbi:MAG: hypothetical protein E8A46_03335 [Bradyrhizobium sp.]|nr:MAG: hypothetical protein E8A46_03335 [Bradyrhizobium sp.]
MPDSGCSWLVIASEAKQSILPRKERMDCFVASLLAMTAGSETTQTSGGSHGHHRLYPLPARSVQARDVRGIRQALDCRHSEMRR